MAGGPAGLSAADLEAEMNMAVEQGFDDKASKGGWFGKKSFKAEPEPKKQDKAKVPAMKDIGKVGAEAPSYTALFEAKKAQRYKGKPGTGANPPPVLNTEEPSAAAAMFGPDAKSPKGKDSSSPQGGQWAAPPPPKQGAGAGGKGRGDSSSDDDDYPPIALPVGAEGGSAADILRAMNANHQQQAEPDSREGEKEEGIRAWLQQADSGPGGEEAPDDSPKLSSEPPRQSEPRVVPPAGNGGKAADGAAAKGPGLLDGASAAAGSLMPKRPTTANEATYTEAFSKGSVPTFPTEVPPSSPPKKQPGCECTIL